MAKWLKLMVAAPRPLFFRKIEGVNMTLTEAEKQEIIRFVEADKPLPEKYRFLLFEDKREVEPTEYEEVWAGGYRVRQRIAEFPHEEGPFNRTKERVPRMRAGASQYRRKGGRHLRQRHDEDCGRKCAREQGDEVVNSWNGL
jgi:hypothetical protein